jgi:hypothetical protein
MPNLEMAGCRLKESFDGSEAVKIEFFRNNFKSIIASKNALL